VSSMTQTRLIRIVLCSLLLVGASLCSQAQLFDRGLPTANLNNAAGANRSNVAWGFGYEAGEGNNEWFTGDDFTLPANSPGKVWRVTKIRIWAVAGAAGDPGFKLGDRYYNVTLYGSGGHGAVVPIKSGDIAPGTNTALIPGTTTANPDITFTPVQYAGGLDYQTGSGAFAQIWQTDFVNLDWLVPGGRPIRFGVHGLVYDNVNRVWFNHASNAALSGSTQDGADDLMRDFYVHNLQSGDGTWDSDGYGWDKSSDINVQV